MSADGLAARWMLISAGGLSFIPLCLDLSGGADAPLLLRELYRKVDKPLLICFYAEPYDSEEPPKGLAASRVRRLAPSLFPRDRRPLQWLAARC